MIKQEYLPTVYCWHPVRIWCSWVSAFQFRDGPGDFAGWSPGLGKSSKQRQQKQAIYLLANQVLLPFLVVHPYGQLDPTARTENNTSHSVCSKGLGTVRGRSGEGKLKASCNQSRFPGVNRVSLRLKISLPVAEPSHGAEESCSWHQAGLCRDHHRRDCSSYKGLWTLAYFLSCNKTQVDKEGGICLVLMWAAVSSLSTGTWWAWLCLGWVGSG